MIAQTVRVGVELEQFRPVDPELTADHILFLLMQGLHARTTTNQDTAVERVQTIIDDVIEDIAQESPG